MTLELCAETSAGGNYKYFGVEFGMSCPADPLSWGALVVLQASG